MNHTYHRGSQPPTSHMVPGAPGVPTHSPLPGFVQHPPPLLPGIFLTETIGAIRGESAGQARLIKDQYSSVARGYTEMNTQFELYVRQTDRILAEQHSRHEQTLEGVRNDTRRFCDTQTAAIADLGARLSVLESAIEASGEAMASKIAALAEAVGNGFTRLAVIMGKNENGAQDRFPLENETPADGLEEGASGEVAPSTPAGYDLEADQAPSTPVAEDFFDPASPLTPVSSPQDRGKSQTPVASPETRFLTPDSGPPNAPRQKRKRTLSKPNATKKSRRKRELEPQETQEDISGSATPTEESHVDPSIWPPVIGPIAENRMYIECDLCAKCFHQICVGLERDREDKSPWTCPLCVQDPTREATPLDHEEKCSRPGCDIPGEGEYFMDRLMGRCYVPSEGVIKYLVSYEYYGLNQCTWEPPENFSNDTTKIDELWECWSRENPGVDHRTLNPRETVLLHQVYVLARDHRQTWPGA